ncbi:uncharacterized protein LOC105156833 [Sesamum indicum]|uniref:Uncharacterized protein LOC105156833 n=1 Tax=Sesamum indicum TaxID=4182 RepID=A0A6I9SQ80_SESIN|nr:uncharacterized protein LOC105156833 [Sesamum indicum]XP_011071368.1 uncharacterized protein LOC105156833 [Sesamum indicum]XP_011071369.1 uncharacterized protein LOC105156833 [Sesamum indicum]XP_020548660.1 uncharacterized protein LOC105156833 [Sesamum indicum]
MKERDIVIDIKSCVDRTKKAGDPEFSDVEVGNLPSFTVCGMPTSADELADCENSVSPSSNVKILGGISPDSGKKTKKEKRFSMSAKKPPKPPRPPRRLSLDAADQKLIKEISELARIKRARIERMKVLKRMKAAKVSSASASSSGNLIAMLFTILFCIVIIFQGCHPLGILPRNSSSIGILGSTKSNGATEGNIVIIHEQWNISASSVPLSGVESPSLTELIPGSVYKDAGEKATN